VADLWALQGSSSWIWPFLLLLLCYVKINGRFRNYYSHIITTFFGETRLCVLCWAQCLGTNWSFCVFQFVPRENGLCSCCCGLAQTSCARKWYNTHQCWPSFFFSSLPYSSPILLHFLEYSRKSAHSSLRKGALHSTQWGKWPFLRQIKNGHFGL
jgi:hypothetical protein